MHCSSTTTAPLQAVLLKKKLRRNIYVLSLHGNSRLLHLFACSCCAHVRLRWSSDNLDTISRNHLVHDEGGARWRLRQRLNVLRRTTWYITGQQGSMKFTTKTIGNLPPQHENSLSHTMVMVLYLLLNECFDLSTQEVDGLHKRFDCVFNKLSQLGHHCNRISRRGCYAIVLTRVVTRCCRHGDRRWWQLAMPLPRKLKGARASARLRMPSN